MIQTSQFRAYKIAYRFLRETICIGFSFDNSVAGAVLFSSDLATKSDGEHRHARLTRGAETGSYWSLHHLGDKYIP